MNAAVAQWIGCREHQEDVCVVRHFSEGTLAVVCDGMGGHSCGDVAAETAAETFIGTFAEMPSEDSVPERFQAALTAANEAVGRLFEGSSLYGGCTLTALYASVSLLWWVSVGDSPLMLWRAKHLHRLNADHSMRAFYEGCVREGSMSLAEALSHGHVLRSALTGEALRLVDLPTQARILLPGDRLVLATDGVEKLLFSPVLSDAARRALSAPFPDAAASLVEACRALNDECADNTTVIVLDA